MYDQLMLVEKNSSILHPFVILAVLVSRGFVILFEAGMRVKIFDTTDLSRVIFYLTNSEAEQSSTQSIEQIRRTSQ